MPDYLTCLPVLSGLDCETEKFKVTRFWDVYLVLFSKVDIYQILCINMAGKWDDLVENIGIHWSRPKHYIRDQLNESQVDMLYVISVFNKFLN
jgi:hypothetical protein